MQDTLMAEPLVLVSLLLVTSFLLWLLADSDDDNSGGGLRQPVLVPIPVRRNQRLVRAHRAIQISPLRWGFFLSIAANQSGVSQTFRQA